MRFTHRKWCTKCTLRNGPIECRVRFTHRQRRTNCTLQKSNGHGIHGRTRKNKTNPLRVQMRRDRQERTWSANYSPPVNIAHPLLQERISCTRIMATEPHGRTRKRICRVRLRTENGARNAPCENGSSPDWVDNTSIQTRRIAGRMNPALLNRPVGSNSFDHSRTSCWPNEFGPTTEIYPHDWGRATTIMATEPHGNEFAGCVYAPKTVHEMHPAKMDLPLIGWITHQSRRDALLAE